MNAAARILDAMRRTALEGQIADFQTVARHQNLAWRHKGGSHCVFVRADGKTLPVPARRPIKPASVKMFLALVDGD